MYTFMISALMFIGLLSSANLLAKAYKGAEVYSNQTEHYGRYVMRMQMAKGSGVVSSFFTYKDGSEQVGAFWEEIDLEVFGKNDAFQWQSNIIQGQPRKTTEEMHTHTASLGDSYHTYIVEWTPSYVAWFIDGQEIRKIAGGDFITSLDNPQSLRFNLWPPTAESWAGAFNETVLPVYQFINYVEYYRYDISTKTFSLLWRDDFNDLSSNRWGLANWTFAENRADFAPENVQVKDGVMILALTLASATGFKGSVPADNQSSSATSSVLSSSSTANSSTATASSTQSSMNNVPIVAPKSSSGGGSTSFQLVIILLLFCFLTQHRKESGG